MRVLADLHHSDLFESYQLTLSDRYGWPVYAPIGMGWFDQGYWAFEKSFHGDAVAKQYLVGIWPDATQDGEVWEQPDGTHPGRTLRGYELSAAREQRWDIIICSLPEWSEHLAGFRRLADETGAKLVAQLGNVGAVQRIDWSQIDGALVSTTTHGVTIPVPHVIYRQEFSLADFRYEWPPKDANSVGSFIQCFAENPPQYAEFLTYARDYPDFRWKVYGAYGSHPVDEFACGNMPSTPKVAEAMRNTRIAWHAKLWSDGYGHVWHNLHAVGRPIFAYKGYYASEIGGELMDHDFDLGSMSRGQVMDTLRRLRDDDDYHRGVCEAVRARFDEVVDFDEDAERVRALLESL